MKRVTDEVDKTILVLFPKSEPAEQVVHDIRNQSCLHTEKQALFLSLERAPRSGGTVYIIGRTKRADIFLSDSAVSSKHCTVSVTKTGTLHLHDQSRKGTKINDEILHNKPREIEDGMRIDICGAEFVVKLPIKPYKQMKKARHVAQNCDTTETASNDKLQRALQLTHQPPSIAASSVLHVPELVMFIASHLEDKDLFTALQVTECLHSLFNDKPFWQKKLRQHGLANLAGAEMKVSELRHLYQHLVPTLKAIRMRKAPLRDSHSIRQDTQDSYTHIAQTFSILKTLITKANWASAQKAFSQAVGYALDGNAGERSFTMLMIGHSLLMNLHPISYGWQAARIEKSFCAKQPASLRCGTAWLDKTWRYAAS